MQTILPLYPVNTEYINESLGICHKDGIITYISNGMPIFSHACDDYKSFRYITAKFVILGRCSQQEIADCFKVSYDSVKRSVKRLRELGDRDFNTKDNRHGNAYKLLPPVLERIQAALDGGSSNCEIARNENVSEGTIRYAIKKGQLKKKDSSHSQRLR
jgi:transposase